MGIKIISSRQLKTAFLLLACLCFSARGDNPYVDFYQQQTYRQVLKDLVLARCLAQVADKGSQFSADAARSASAFIEWIPFDAENGTDKVEASSENIKIKLTVFIQSENPMSKA